MSAKLQPDKMEVVQHLLTTEGRVMLCLDATRVGVVVPRRFSSDPGLMLVINQMMPQPIKIGPEAIESELRFGGIPHYCVVPFNALWGAFNPESNHGMLWPESMPDSLRERYGLYPSGFPKPVLPPDTKLSTAKSPVSALGKSPVFKVIEGGSGESGANGKPPKIKPTLKLVK